MALVIRRALTGVAVIRCPRAELAALLPRLDHEDDVALADDPPQLLYFRLVAASQRAHPTRDSLTGLAGTQRFVHALAAATAANDAVSLIVVNIDWLKLLNDRLGHAAGDAALREVARRLGELTPPGSLLARVGGEQFGMLCAGATDPARRLAGQLLEAIRARPIEGETVTASAGIAASAPPISGDKLLRDANEALFAAKAGAAIAPSTGTICAAPPWPRTATRPWPVREPDAGPGRARGRVDRSARPPPVHGSSARG